MAVNKVYAAGVVFNPVPPLAIVKAVPRVNEDACSALWKIDAPVTPIPPVVTNKAELCVATPANVDVEPNIAVPDTPKPVPIFTFPETPNPPTIVNAPEVEVVEFVLIGMLTRPVVPTTKLSVAEAFATSLILFGENVPRTRSPVCDAT